MFLLIFQGANGFSGFVIVPNEPLYNHARLFRYIMMKHTILSTLFRMCAYFIP